MSSFFESDNDSDSHSDPYCDYTGSDSDIDSVCIDYDLQDLSL